MAEYYNVTTNLGDAEIANAIATNTKLNITHIAFGDGNGSVPTPNKTRTSLVREVHRQAVTKYERHATNANWIVIETIIPSNIGGFTIREMGIIANGKLISHGSHAPFEKVADPSGVSEYRLRFTQNVTDGSVVELRLDESLIYATQAWIDENYIKRSEIVDDLITDDVDKVASARTVKELQDNKLEKTDLKDATTIVKGVSRFATATEVANKSNVSAAVTPSNAALIAQSTDLGVGQTWQNVTGSRSLESVYSNETGRPIQVAITIAGHNNFLSSVLFVNDLEIVRVSNSNQYGQDKNICIVIPSGSTYRLSGSAFSRWSELR